MVRVSTRVTEFTFALRTFIWLMPSSPHEAYRKHRDRRTMGALGAVSAVVGNGEGRVHKEYNDTTLWEVLCYQHS